MLQREIKAAVWLNLKVIRTDHPLCPILDYGSEIWGYKSFNKIDAIQNKAIRIYLGVHRFAPTADVSGDMGWTHSSVRHKVYMIRFWNKIVSLDNSRLPRKLLESDINCKGNTWVLTSSLLSSINQARAFQTRKMVCPKTAWACLHETYCNQCKIESLNKPKVGLQA